MIKRFHYGAAACMLLAGLLLTACGNSSTTNKSKNNSDEGKHVQNSAAEIIYKKKCMSCHGTDLQGRSGPSLQHIGSKLSEDEIVHIVANGQRGMPKFEKRIPPEDIQRISKWLSELK
ncbi:c-type cytochrome [Paenibacillus sinopodophylli]|uniref:c-type cytochrome n=1 Tax=Paenibacillus sinopodophylli TaxID=1837342 RepID=UPI00110D22AA|nr:cytochrome c [Paenibacillus sinopodophylli]